MAHGPFAGMSLTPDTTGSLLPPYLVGSFESALHPIIHALSRVPPDRVLNVGCGDGYYAAGFARLWPGSTVLAYDPHAPARSNTEAWCRAAGVADQVRILDGATRERLGQDLREGSLVWCDCEGAEADLADPTLAHGPCRWVVELHPWTRPDLEEELAARFDSAHDLEWIGEVPPDPRAWEILERWPAGHRAALLDEGREHPGRWLVAIPRETA